MSEDTKLWFMIAMIAIFALYGLDYSLPFQKAGTDLKAVWQLSYDR